MNTEASYNNKLFSKENIVSLMDLTSLNSNDTPETIQQLINNSNSSLGKVAALCVYSPFIPQVKSTGHTSIKVATVVNFPAGNQEIPAVIEQIYNSITLGADEIDLVIPYQEYIEKGGSDKALQLIKASKTACGEKILKVIIESGELKSRLLIQKTAREAMENGADFIKTSTGKTPVGATLQAAEFILKEIKKFTSRKVGFKASGGIKTEQEALEYIKLAISICGENFIQPSTFRFGVSSLLSNLLNSNYSTTYNY